MKAEILKIANVKTEKEFYKKFPNEKTFMAKHGKAVKKLMVKKAQVGSMIKNIDTPTGNVSPTRIDNDYLNDHVASLTGGKSQEQLRQEEMYNAQLSKLQEQSGGGGGGGLSGLISMGQKAYAAYNAQNAKGAEGAIDVEGVDIGGADVGSGRNGETLSKFFMGAPLPNAQTGKTFGQKAKDVYNSKAVQDYGIPIIDDIVSINDTLKAQKEAKAVAKQSRMVSDVALQASKTQPERIERDYVRPEDIEMTGEEFFPIYGVGTNVLAKNGGMFSDQTYASLNNVNQEKIFNQGGYLKKAQDGASFSDMSYGGGAMGGFGMQAGQVVGFNNDAGSQIGGKIGGTIGSIFGPVGGAIGGFIGGGIGDMLDRDDRRIEIDNDKAERNNKELSYSAVAPSVQAGYASHVRNGGNVVSDLFKDGGNLPSNPSALDTMAMGGDIKTLWGGSVDTVSYNPYAGGESIEFKGNSHDNYDPKTRQTGIGVAYGEQSVANNEAVVEVENEPAQKLRDGGGDENLVIYGDLKIPDEYVDEIGDNRAKGMKFKNYVSKLNKDESKINNKMGNAADVGLESDQTIWGQLERATSNVIIDGGDEKLKNIATKKNILADLQSALNDTFDDFQIKGNEFINRSKIVTDPERVANAKSGKTVPKAQDGNESENEFVLNTLPKDKKNYKNAAEAKKDGFEFNKKTNNWERGNETAAIEEKKSSSSALDNVRKGQKSGEKFSGNVTEEQFETLKTENPWFDWSNFDLSKKVKYNGKMVSADTLRYQKEFNKISEDSGSDVRIKADGYFGEQTASARFSERIEGAPASNVIETATVDEPTTTAEETTLTPKIPNIPNFMNRTQGEGLDGNQLLAEQYAMATNQVQPVYAQSYTPNLNVPYDISLQDQMNEIIAQSRALSRSTAFEGNPAAAALMAAPMYEAINKVKADEFRANQAMKSQNVIANNAELNRAQLTNLEIFDKQQDKQAEATSKTRTQNIDILSSISDKYSQRRLENRLEQTYQNLYPTFGFDRNFQTRVQQQATFNTGQGSKGGQPSLSTPGFNGNANNFSQGFNEINSWIDYFRNSSKQDQERIKKEEEAKKLKEQELTPITPESKNGRVVKNNTKKNNKNSNILRALRDL